MDLAGGDLGGGSHACPSTREATAAGAPANEADLAIDEAAIDDDGQDEEVESEVSLEGNWDEDEDDDDGDETEDEPEDDDMVGKAVKKRARNTKAASVPSGGTKKQRGENAESTSRETKTAATSRVAERRRISKQENVAAVVRSVGKTGF